MAKAKKTTAFFCQSCGYESAKWTGQCPACKEWNTMVEEPVRMEKASGRRAKKDGTNAVTLSEIDYTEKERTETGFLELDRVLGGGIVPGSMILLGGDPGIGKSTLLLQVALHIAETGRSVLYVSGEESLAQIGMRAKRLQEKVSDRVESNLLFLCETMLSDIISVVEEKKPHIVIIDSIQTMFSEDVQSSPGSVSQVRETTGVLLRVAKETGTTFFIVGHVTKDGTVAGPRVLEHMVDAVLYFEGDRYASYRILRGVKNRFGATNEIGIFEMRGDGLAEVENASEFLLSGRPKDASGAIVSCTVEGTRPLLVEVQALITKTNFGFPKRQSTGMDYNRVSVLMAVIEKRLGVPMSEYDAYVNLAGGMKQKEPALDLSVVLAILSGYRNVPVSPNMIAFGEVGLSGEVRAVQMAKDRIREAIKMGFTTIVLPKASLAKLEKIDGAEMIGVENIREAAELIR